MAGELFLHWSIFDAGKVMECLLCLWKSQARSSWRET